VLSVHVHVQVKRGFEKAFLQATLANARQSRAEPGIARFEVGQSREDPQHFLLVEVYRAPRGSPSSTKRPPTMPSGGIRWPP